MKLQIPTKVGILLWCISCFTLVNAQRIIFSDDFEFGEFKENWRPRPSLSGPDGLVGVRANSSINGVARNSTFGVVMGKTIDGSFTSNALDLVLDLSPAAVPSGEVNLEFWISDNEDNTNPQDGLYLSEDGGANFTQVFSFLPDSWCNNTYGKFAPFDIDELASSAGLQLSENFVIRILQHGESDLSGAQEDGFYIDDVLVYEPAIVYVPLPFQDDFEEEWGNMWSLGDATKTVANPEQVKPTQRVLRLSNSQLSGVANSGEFGVGLYKACEDGFGASVLDLHVDLSPASAPSRQVAFSFWIADNEDNTNPQDGIYFSDDGGRNFQKVQDFLPGLWCNNTYGLLPPIDVDELASSKRLELTDRFVIRIQQFGENL